MPLSGGSARSVAKNVSRRHNGTTHTDKHMIHGWSARWWKDGGGVGLDTHTTLALGVWVVEKERGWVGWGAMRQQPPVAPPPHPSLLGVRMCTR